MNLLIIKKIILLFFFLFFANAVFASSDESSNNTAEVNPNTTSQLIDIVGQQRMLVHRTLVAYAQIGQIQSYGNPVNMRLSAIRKFEENLDIISTDPRFAFYAQNMRTIWLEYKTIILLPSDKSKMPLLIDYNEKIIAYADKIIKILVRENKGNINVVNIAGKQRMLSQRIALYMLADNWGLEGNYTHKMQLALSEFARNLNRLKQNKDNTQEINKRIASMKKDYKRLIKIVSNKTAERDYSFSISRYSSQLLRKAKHCTQMYVELKNQTIYARGRSDKPISKKS